MGNEIERIESILEDASEELRKSANVLWPTQTDVSDIHESNLCLYIGHSFLKKRLERGKLKSPKLKRVYSIYNEVRLNQDINKRLDLLAGKNDKSVLIYLQAKRFDRKRLKVVEEIIEEIENLNNYLNIYPPPEGYENSLKYLAIVISFWLVKNSDRYYLEWWDNMNKNFNKPQNCRSKLYEWLTEHILKNLKITDQKGSIKILDSKETKDGSEWYLLYLIFPLQ